MTDSVTLGAFANGFEYFCPHCGAFFSLQYDSDNLKDTHYCPSCSADELMTTTEELLEACSANCTDPVNFYNAFPPDEPIPQSRTGASPREVKTIIDIVSRRKAEKRPVTVDIVAQESYIPWKAVKRVFGELHITQSGVTV